MRTNVTAPLGLSLGLALTFSVLTGAPSDSQAAPGDQLWVFQGIEDVVCVGWLPDQNSDGVPDALVETYDAGASTSADHLYLLSGKPNGAVPDTIWSVRPPGGPSSSGGYGDKCVTASPDLDGDGRMDVLLGTAWGGRSAYGIRGYDGHVLWTFDTYLSVSGWVYQILPFPDRTGDGRPEALFGCGSDNNSAYLVDGSTGILLWIFTAPDAIDAVAVGDDVDGDGVSEAILGGIDNDNHVWCIDGSSMGTGTVLWSHDAGRSVWTLARLDEDLTGDGTSEILAGTWGNGVQCLRGEDGTVYWTYPTGTDYVQRVVSLDDVNGDGVRDVAVGTWDNSALVLSGADGTRIWQSYTGTLNGGDVWAIDRIDDITGDGVNDVIAGSFDYNVWAFDGASGDTLWTSFVSNRLYTVRGVPDMSENGSPDVVAGTQKLTGSPGGRAYLIEGGSGLATGVAQETVSLTANATAEGVELSWDWNPAGLGAAGAVVEPRFNLYRIELPGVPVEASQALLRSRVESGQLKTLAAVNLAASAPAPEAVLVNDEPIHGSGSAFRYLDRGARPGASYQYVLTRVVGGGGDLRLAVADVRLGAPELASGIAVAPNPTHGSCSVLFRAAEAGAARVTVHDVTGRVVRRILDGRVEAGGQEVHWDGRDERGREEPAGIYFVTVETENQVRSKKVIMLR